MSKLERYLRSVISAVEDKQYTTIEFREYVRNTFLPDIKEELAGLSQIPVQAADVQITYLSCGKRIIVGLLREYRRLHKFYGDHSTALFV